MASNRKVSTAALPKGYHEDSTKPPMLRFEDSLPKLPVPTLEEAAARYLRSIRPILSPTELQRTSDAVQDFIKPGGIGSVLQERLLARREETKNWLYDWWNDAAYLAFRDPVVPYVSYFYSHRGPRGDPSFRAAAITRATLDFKRLVDNEALEPDYMKSLPNSMESNRWMFNVTRLPEAPVDRMVKYPAKENAHIIVMRKNQFFKVAHEVDGKTLSVQELQKQFKWIYDHAEVRPAVGALTSENRDIWTRARAILLAADNEQAVHDVEAASFIVCLDDASPVTLEERARGYWHGDGCNRWYDKPLQFIINDNGTSGFMGEHSMMDGTTTHRLNDFVGRAVAMNQFELGLRSHLPLPQSIHFNVNAEIEAEIVRAKNDFAKIIAEHDLRIQVYEAYGKGLIKKMGCSPDAYVQMIIQLAFYRMHGESRPTYESVMTRRFQQGRTEACRSVSEASAAFCHAMSQAQQHTSQELAALLRKALKSHVEYVTAAAAGKGVDRHLFGLKKLLQPGEEVPAIFTDPAYSYSSTWEISTSQISSKYLNGFGWSQVVDHGWGIAYMIDEDSLQFNIVSKRRGCERMSFFINEAASEMRDLLLSAPEPVSSKL